MELLSSLNTPRFLLYPVMKDTLQQPSNLIHFDEPGFSSYELPPGPPSGHIHDALEICAFEGGSVTMLYGGKTISVPENRLVIHWGMLPHQVVRRDPLALVVGIHLPLVWFLQWQIPAHLTARLLGLDLLIEPPRQQPCSDLAMLKNWHHLLGKHGREGIPVVLAEVRARLLGLALSHNDLRDDGLIKADHLAPSAFHRTLQEITQHFREPLQIARLAKQAGISPRHLTRIFHEHTGQTINEYLTRLRLSHAQRLLITTDRKVIDVMYDCGFTCSTHFYKVFREQAGCTPRHYRLQSIQ